MPIKSFADIRGWFFWEDTVLFRDILAAQTQPGTLVELGAFLGRSAALMGEYQKAGDRFVVVDLFGVQPEDIANAAENELAYSTVDPHRFREQFEANYLALHPELPEIVQALSSTVADYVEPASVRFAHIDASHLYEHVALDLQVMRDLLHPDGVVVFDDYRAVHTPGVAAAVWEGVANHGLVPFALSPFKMYATWGDSTEHAERARRLGRTEPRMNMTEQMILGHKVVRVEEVPAPAVKPPPPPKLSAAELEAITEAIAARVTQRIRGSIRPKRSRSDWAPPVLVDWVRARRKKQ
ncbi:MAG: class I SAM-dependent methyltransferase [Jatrophihabitantaceae bacterium]